jgi:hypothetical protein
MTHPTITCERFNEQLADFLERAVAEPTRAAMESHAIGCDDCGPLLADLRRLRIDAANLTELAPSRDLWLGIAARIEAPVVAMPGVRHAPSARWSRPAWFGIAAAALIAVTATITHEMTKRSLTANPPTQAAKPEPVTPSTTLASTDSQPAVQPSSGPAVEPSMRPAVQPSSRAAVPGTRLASNRPSAEQTYDQEIARLLVVYNKRRPDLDSTTIAVVKKNLKIIDDAIAQTRLALKRDPASQFLMESLNDAFDTKVQLLRNAAMMPSGT